MYTIAQLITTFGKHNTSGEVCRKLNEHLSSLGIKARTQHLPTADNRIRRFMIDFNDPRQASFVSATLPESKGVLFGYSVVVFSVTDD